MNASTKVFSILSLSAAMGTLMVKTTIKDRTQKEVDMIRWRGQKLAESGTKAVESYPLPSLTQSKINQIERKINEICKENEDFLIVEKLSFLIAALVDIRAKINNTRWKHIDQILKRASWCLQLFDPKFEQEQLYLKALNDFERWAA